MNVVANFLLPSKATHRKKFFFSFHCDDDETTTTASKKKLESEKRVYWSRSDWMNYLMFHVHKFPFIMQKLQETMTELHINCAFKCPGNCEPQEGKLYKKREVMETTSKCSFFRVWRKAKLHASMVEGLLCFPNSNSALQRVYFALQTKFT